ncbi:glycoside hydrolase [Microthyrium microscopicum]|uniref:Glycoside hydrolase n=1 Tax=Microthyrium microscopicum TaxID=703497 RepID=A0A6A6TYQ7_9PEZI|nr:glycoside hydrolase [Microthyrium microscopicum]
MPKKLCFSLKLDRPTEAGKTETKFTVRFRNSPKAEWKWANDQLAVSDGSVYWQPVTVPKHDIGYYLTKQDPAIEAEQMAAQTPDTLLWSLTAPVDAAQGDVSTISQYRFGLATNFTRWFATTRLMTTWFRPRHGKHKFFTDNQDAVCIAFLRNDGLSVVVLGLSGIDDTGALFTYDADGYVVLKARNDGTQAAHAKVLVSVAPTFELANAAVMYEARSLSRAAQTDVMALEQQIQGMNLKDVDAQWLEEWYDGFGFCTWNALGQNLTEQKILDTLDEFKKDKIDITTLIIDDNWQSLDNEGQDQGRKGMTRFEADATAFPSGMKGLITKIKTQHPHIKRVAVWHTMLGYWGAISPTGELAKTYKTIKALNNSGWEWTCIAPEDIDRFYNDFYKFLQSCNVDGVKTDSQNSLDDLQHAPDRRTMQKSYQDAWILAGLRYLGARQIGCGSQVPAIVFHSMINTSTPRIVVRNSDDFFPDNDGSHPWHIFANAHNALMMQHLHILPDWDMFQTDHKWAAYHAAARCVSGGPIYITDAPGKHDKDLIGQMTAQTTRGTTVILRTERLGKASQAYIAYEEPKLLKIDTYNGMARTGTGVLGVFNVSQAALSELVGLVDFPGSEEGEYVVRSHTLERTSLPMRRGEKHAFVHAELDVGGYDILTAYPLKDLSASCGKIQVANLGLVGKMSGAAAIISSSLYFEDERAKVPSELAKRARVWTSLKALGTWGVWIDRLPELSVEDDLMAMMLGKPIPLHLAKISETDERVLEIDLAKAWKDGDYESSWSNEVAVELFIR